MNTAHGRPDTLGALIARHATATGPQKAALAEALKVQSVDLIATGVELDATLRQQWAWLWTRQPDDRAGGDDDVFLAREQRFRERLAEYAQARDDADRVRRALLGATIAEEVRERWRDSGSSAASATSLPDGWTTSR